jgi:hypothetical protein
LAAALLGTAPSSSAGPAQEEVVTLISTTEVGQTRYRVPGSISTVHVVAIGAEGGAADCGCLSPDNALPGKGARVEGDLTVEGGSELFLNVGGVGGEPNPVDAGFNGGGAGAASANGVGFGGGGGGGATDVRMIRRSDPGTLDSRLIVAAGGGGGGLYGGGGGGGGTNAGTCPIPGGGGGGGGSSLVPPGGSASIPDPAVPATVTITASTPLTEITHGPPRIVTTKGRSKAVRVKFESPSGASAFECSVDRREYKDCISPLERKFRLGGHLVRVRAVNLADNADQTPARAKFRIRRR